MPLSRYQIRNEFSLSDRELYKAADKDDPEALLEGFAMASLVGVLRQLGDLTAFATVVFSDLHDEVTATAARGNRLMVRVKQLEVELPLIENEFLKQTNHSSFFYNAGNDWRPNMHISNRCITKRGLPRFMMDLYEETRAPPRLFLLDKFDVGGVGSCFKRYTNPSFYKEEAAAIGTTNSDMQGEMKSRKGKRRGTHWRNGRTSEALRTPHSKLHQLLLEEKIEDNASDPARPVKLKRRLNGFPFDSKTGQSYLEKILKDRSPDHKDSAIACDLETEVKRHCTGSENHDKNSYPKLEIKNVVSNTFRGERDYVTSNSEQYDSPKGNNILGAHNSSSNSLENVGERKIIVDRERKLKDPAVAYQSDDVINDVEIYIDLLVSEPQMDFAPNLKAMTDFHVSGARKEVPGLKLTKSLHQAHFPDSQSKESSTSSDDGISPLKKRISTSSYSNGASEIAGGTHLRAELSNAYLFDEIFEAKNTSSPERSDAGCNYVTDNSTLSSDNSELTVSNGIPAQRDEKASLGDHSIQKVQRGRLSVQRLPEAETSNATESEIKLEQNAPFNSDTCISPRQGDFGYSFGIFDTNQTLASVQDKHLYRHEPLSCAPNLSNISYSRRASENKDIQDSDDEDLHLHPNYGALVNNEEILSAFSPKYDLLNDSADNDLNLREDPPNLTSKDESLKAVDRDFMNPKVTPEDPPSPVFNLLPEPAKINLEEVPPLPPLPPVQWRNRKNQPIPLAQENEALSDNESPSSSQSMTNQKIPHHAVMGKDLPLVHEFTSGKSVHDGPFSSLVNHILLNERHLRSQNLSAPGNRTDMSSLGEIKSVTQKLPLPENLDGMSQHDDHIETNSNTMLRRTSAVVTAVGDTAQAHALAPMFQQKGAWVTRSTDNSFVQYSPSAEGSASASTLEGGAAPLKAENGQPKVMKLFQEGESVWPSEAEEKRNDVQAMKLPRLGNPLMDDVVAHDSRKLKKVKERIDSEIKVSDGRGSLLEQIRTKSFNLKPAVMQRPNIQGPTTNLRVAAILEKAKTIRLAFAGSEEDDDDSWSD